MANNTLNSTAEEYFYSINSLAERIGADITATKEAYEGLWNNLSLSEKNQAINETIIQPEVALKYTVKKVELVKELPEWYPKLRIQTGMKYVIDETGSTLRWRDEHSAPFSFMTQSQMNLSTIESADDIRGKSVGNCYDESPQFSSPAKSQRTNSNSFNDNYSLSQASHYQSGCYSSSLYEDEQGENSLKTDSGNIFTKLINKRSLLRLQNNIADDMESLVREGDSDTEKSRSNTLVIMTRKSSDINESTALLETPSSYNSFQSSQLNEEESDESIPKTGFEFLDNW